MHLFKSAQVQLVFGEEILEMDGEEVIAGAGGGVSSAAALLVAVAVDLAEVAEVGAADARDDVAGEVPDGAVAAAHLEGEVVQGALTVHDEPVLLRAEVPHWPEHLVERPVVRVGHRHQPGEQEPRDRCSVHDQPPVFQFRGSITMQ